MAYFAKINENNIVEQVVSVNNAVLLDDNGVEQPEKGVQFLKDLYKDQNAKWLQTSYNNRIRKVFAGVGYKYDSIKDVFIPAKPDFLNSWIFNEDKWLWTPPFEQPTTYLTFPKDRQGNIMKRVLFNPDTMEITQYTEKDVCDSDVYIWREDLLNWELPQLDIITPERQEQFLLVNNL